jgi:hypothetical protein
MKEAGVVSEPEVSFHTGGWAKFSRAPRLIPRRATRPPRPRTHSLARRKQEPMPTVIAYHDVKDLDHWLASTVRDEAFATLGITGIRTFVDPTNPHRVGLLADVPDLDALLEALQSPEFAEAEAKDGVVPETIVMLVES